MGVAPLRTLRRAVFLDRDGVLNKAIVRDGKPFPPVNLDELEIATGALSALALLKQHDLALIVVSNQPDVARGLCSRRDVEQINATLAATLPIERFFVCYHDDCDGCPCRKPKPGLFLDAAAWCGIDLGASFAIGDRWRDIESAATAGVKSIFIDYGYAERRPIVTPDATVENVLAGAQWVVDNLSCSYVPAAM